MLKIKNMADVSECSCSECAYNKDLSCHTMAITIGDGDNPLCDTFFKSAAHGGVKGTAGVGACKVSACRHNENFECAASQIQIGTARNGSSCMTFSAR